jgi:hypothetical protein
MGNELIPIGMSLPDIAGQFAASGYFPDAKNAAQAVVKVMAGRELGIGPFASMSGIHIIEGKPEIGAHLIAAAIKASGKYDYRIVERTATACRIAFFQRSGEAWEKIGEEYWDQGRAERAGLARRGNWTKFPEAMLFSRAISSGYRVFCPDVFSSPVYSEGEIAPAELPVARLVEAPAMDLDPEPKVSDEVAKLIADCEIRISGLDQRSRKSALEWFATAGNDPEKLAKLLVWLQPKPTEPDLEPEPEPEPKHQNKALLNQVKAHVHARLLSHEQIEAVLVELGLDSIDDLPESRLMKLDRSAKWAKEHNNAED